MKKCFYPLVLLLAGLTSYAQGTRLLRQPTLSSEKIVFVYADDLWIADRNGGTAQRLTSNEGTESEPHFSPDEQFIAFTAEYDGNTDVYIIPADGGDPQRLTFHPGAGIWGPKVMIINERAGSGGDLLPYMFKAANIGPLVGTRTWGGLVGTWDTPPFIDGGRFVAPRGGFFDLNGEWAVEGEGIEPDIEVIQDPKMVLEGHDPQLEVAIEEAMRLLREHEFELKPEPEAPIRYRRPEGN